VLFVLIAVAAPAVAGCAVPDLTWIGGVYDGGDGDEALGLVFDRAPAVESAAIVLRVPSVAATLVPPVVLPATFRPSPASGSRAPPA
jgi:hypothetical protein